MVGQLWTFWQIFGLGRNLPSPVSADLACQTQNWQLCKKNPETFARVTNIFLSIKSRHSKLIWGSQTNSFQENLMDNSTCFFKTNKDNKITNFHQPSPITTTLRTEWSDTGIMRPTSYHISPPSNPHSVYSIIVGAQLIQGFVKTRGGPLWNPKNMWEKNILLDVKMSIII